jgi:hypothetical protein
MRLIHLVLSLALAAAVPAEAASRPAQTELDRVVARVNNRIITRSDVRQARLLRLVAHPESDESALRDLEDRVLVLADVARAAPLAPSSASDLEARRRAWEAHIGGESRGAALLREAGLSEAGLDSWFADDLRAEAHLNRQFGSLPEADRRKAIADWIARLRQRAGLR